MITSIAFTVYPVSDMARSRAFYEKALGLTVGEITSDRWVEYAVGNGTFGITTVDLGDPPGTKGALVAFEVADLDGFVRDLKAKGVPFAMDDILETPVCRMTVIEDPDGNHVTIHKRHEG